ncbi:MAG: RtcB family protein [Alphaproteobacteria bacterium]|jgi:tRNA-splicing ligase RtcB|nr:RtcB family protein [Alphaproteobacteria bacterium]MDP6564995.1 RtcB family protein [Alphaproteobacteria bacterium]
MSNYNYIPTDGVAIKAWTKGVPVEDAAEQQLRNVASLPFIHRHVAAMPDVHWGKGATVGSVIPCKGAIIPAAVGVDIGCGMMAVQTSLTSHQLPGTLRALRGEIERAVPHGRTGRGDAKNDSGAWSDPPDHIAAAWRTRRFRQHTLEEGFEAIVAAHPKLRRSNRVHHLGTLRTGNHFIEVCLDEADRVWVMLHSGSRGVGNRIGSYFIELAKRDMQRFFISLPDADLAYLPEGTEHFNDYVKAVSWAQAFARTNREVMMERLLEAMAELFTGFTVGEVAVNCHHNYVAREKHFGADVWVTRKGAVSAREGEFGIIPGSMGERSFIVRGKGNRDSFCSCAHGAGRAMSRNEAKRRFSVDDHAAATEGVECRKDADVIDETPMAYKDIDAVMQAQDDLVEVVHVLKQLVCVKG